MSDDYCSKYTTFLEEEIFNIHNEENNIFSIAFDDYPLRYKFSEDEVEFLENTINNLIGLEKKCKSKVKIFEKYFNNFKSFIKKKEDKYPSAIMIGGADEDRVVEYTMPRGRSSRSYFLTYDFIAFIIFALSVFCIILAYIRLNSSGINTTIEALLESMPVENMYSLIPERYHELLGIQNQPSYARILFDWSNNLLTTRRDDLLEVSRVISNNIAGVCTPGILENPNTWYGMLDNLGEIMRGMMDSRSVSRCVMEVGRLQSSISSHRMESNFDYIFFYLNWGRVMGISSIVYFTRRVYDSYQRNIDDDTMFQPLIRSNSMRSNRSSTGSQSSRSRSSRSRSSRSRGFGLSRNVDFFDIDDERFRGGKKRRKTIKKKKKLIKKKRKSNKLI